MPFLLVKELHGSIEPAGHKITETSTSFTTSLSSSNPSDPTSFGTAAAAAATSTG
uniref:Uncharacterized protein n=1 Tax=Rhizophora mucronata TaxID=61149 RepID=A0A2P2KK24_RHIMU